MTQRNGKTSFSGRQGMIIVFVAVTTPAGTRDEFLKAAQPCIAATRKEAGCRQYELLASTENPDGLHYFERWDSREALDRHMNSPHMAAFGKIKKEKHLQIDESKVTNIYDVAP
jgi:quinol monooxygenase YgiN